MSASNISSEGLSAGLMVKKLGPEYRIHDGGPMSSLSLPFFGVSVLLLAASATLAFVGHNYANARTVCASGNKKSPPPSPRSRTTPSILTDL